MFATELRKPSQATSRYSRFFHWNAFLFLFLIPFYAYSQNNQLGIAYQGAAKFTHILWQPTLEKPIHINLMTLNNFSGIPIEKRSEKVDYYAHGKIPKEIDVLTSSLLQASRQFVLETSQLGDYQFQFSLNSYRLPYQYAPDDNIWKEFKDEVDRWAVKEKPSTVSMTLRILSANKTIPSWSKTVTTKIASCDINSAPQPLLSFASDNKTLRQYLQSTPAQAFIASTNYLIIEALKFLKTNHQLATITRVNGNEFLLESTGPEFKLGDLLPVYQVNNKKTSPFPLGLAEVVKTFGNQAVAYPTNFKMAHARVGDQVEMSIANGFEEPDYRLVTDNLCGQTQVIEAVAR